MIDFSESGDFALTGFGGNAYAQVTAEFFVNIVEVDGVSIQPINLQQSMVMTPSDGDFSLADDGPGPLVQGVWSGLVEIDIDAAVADAGYTPVLGATRVTIVADNSLLAISDEGTTALIEKKDFSGLAIAIIPEPGTLALLVAGIGILGALRRRA
jgi:hypothetical protein